MRKQENPKVDDETTRWVEINGVEYAGSDKCVHWLVGGKPCPGRCELGLCHGTAWTRDGEPAFLVCDSICLVDENIIELALLIERFPVHLYIQANESVIDSLHIEIITEKVKALWDNPSAAERKRLQKVRLRHKGSPTARAGLAAMPTSCPPRSRR